MPSRNGRISIRPSADGVLRGIEPQGGAGGFVIGANTSGIARYLTNWPYADVVKCSDCWEFYSGSGNVTVDLEDRVTAIDAGIILSKSTITSSVDTDVPPGGEYRVRWTGTGEVSAGVPGNVNAYTGWNTPTAGSGEFTFTLTENNDLSLFVREGTILSLECVSAVDYTNYDSGQIFRQSWLTNMLALNNRIIRPLTNSNYEQEFTQRTTTTSLTYGGIKNLETGFQDEEGARSYQIPWEVMCEIANSLDCDLAINLPAFASADYITQVGSVIDQNLEPHRRVFVELANETWNSGPAFYENQQRIGMRDVPKITLSLTPGSNTASSPSHGFLEGETFRVMFSPNTGRIALFDSPYFTNQFLLRAVNVTQDSFDVVFDSDSSPAVAPTDVTEVYAWKTSDYPGNASATIEDIDYNTGTQSVVVWDLFSSSFRNPGRIKEIVGSQHDWVARSLNRTGASGTNGRYDYLSLGPYFGLESATQAWESGDTLSDMLTDGLVDVNITLQAMDDHITAGYLPYKIFCYEGGQHYLNTFITIPQGGDEAALQAEAHTEFTTLNNSSEMATMYQTLHEGLADRGIWGGCTAKSLVNPWSEFGYWYALQTEDETFTPTTALMAGYDGVVEPTP